jgi:hypothetical protein
MTSWWKKMGRWWGPRGGGGAEGRQLIMIHGAAAPSPAHRHPARPSARQVYMQAMMYVVTGDEQYAHNAARIIWAWSTVNRSFTGQNAPLVSPAAAAWPLPGAVASGPSPSLSA